MIPSSHFVHVIQAERERDLERWQRVREARAAARPRAGTGRVARLLAIFEPRGRSVRPTTAITACDGRVAPAACCS